MRMFKTKSKLSQRITWRVIAIMGFFNVFIIGAVFFFDLAISEEGSRTRAQYLIDGIGSRLVTMLRAVEIASTNNVAEIEDNLGSPEQVFDALEHEIRLNNRYLGCFVAFEPDYYKSQGRWFEPYVRISDTINVERVQIGSAQHDYFSQEWYVKGFSLERGKGFLTDPYLDKDGGRRILSTYVSPVFDRQGRKVGVYGIDLNLDWLETTIANEEKTIKMWEPVDEDQDAPNPFFIQIIDSKGHKIAGSEVIDTALLQEILQKHNIKFKSMVINDAHYCVTSRRLAGTNWTLIVAQHRRMVYMSGVALGIVIIFFMTVGGIAVFFFMRWSIRRATKPLVFLSDSAREVAKGNFDTQLPTFKHDDEIAHLRDSFDTMQQSLKSYVEELKASTAAKASIESELNVAHGIQMSMLPMVFPAFADRPEIDLYAKLMPAKAVGGDLYDFLIHEEKLYFCIGDVSGKGVPASLVMAVTQTLFRNIAVHTVSPSHIVETMNDCINANNDESMFVTLFVGVLDLATGHLHYCNAGHNAPYVQGVQLPCNANLPVGIIAGRKFTEQETDIAPGTTIFLYTDGLTEAENARHELFGEERLENAISGFTGSTQELIETMTAAVRQFAGNTEQSDDLTMLAIKLSDNQ